MCDGTGRTGILDSALSPAPIPPRLATAVSIKRATISISHCTTRLNNNKLVIIVGRHIIVESRVHCVREVGFMYIYIVYIVSIMRVQ